MRASTEIIPLTSIRGVAAIWVALAHFWGAMESHGFLDRPGGVAGNVLASSSFQVDVFFVLSGFIMAHIYGTARDTRRFWAGRIARIFPLHLTVLAAVVLAVTLAKNYGVQPGAGGEQMFNYTTLPFLVTLTSVWVGLPMSWNGPAWSLSAEMAAYLTFPLVQTLARKAGRRWLLLAACALLASQVFLLSLLGFAETGVPALLRATVGFWLGSALCYSNLSVAKTATAAAIATVAVLAAGQFAIAAIPAALLVCALSSSSSTIAHRSLSAAPLHHLGKISYSIYLLHAPLIMAIMLVCDRMLDINPSPVASSAIILIFFILMIASATASYVWLERPWTAGLKRILLGGRLRLTDPR